MSKEYFEALETIRNKFIDLFHEDVPDFDTLEDALNRLEAIDNANPSEALKQYETIYDLALAYCEEFNPEIIRSALETRNENIKQALLKAEKEHNSVKLLMQELGCKDMETLRKYARCGYEKLNKKYLKWEDLEFDNTSNTIPVRMGDNVYKMTYCLYENEGFIRLEDCQRIYLELFANEKKFFNDLRLEVIKG